MVEPLRSTTRSERLQRIESAGYNPFLLSSRDVYIDLLTDSGTGAMSDRQWSVLMQGDEAYAGSRSFERLRAAVQEIMGFDYVLPTHQGRGAENILFTIYLERGHIVPNNMHFDTTKAHVLHKGGQALDLPSPASFHTQESAAFKGNMDLTRLREVLEESPPGSIPLIMVTLTCNSAGGQPVSMANLKATRQLADEYGLPLVIDACRFAENAYFIKQREEGFQDRSISEIVREMMSYAHACTMSGKKDALVNIGGFLATSDQRLYDQAQTWSVLFEGFPTYGGLAGRDLEAMAQGLREVVQEEYLADRVGQVAYLAHVLRQAGAPVVEPPGGHAVYIDAGRWLKHIPSHQFPGWSLSVALYVEGGVRSVEIGTVLAGRDPVTQEHDHPALELLRLAVPRRVYTHRHLDRVGSAVAKVRDGLKQLPGMRFIHEPPVLRHFTARLAPLTPRRAFAPA